MASSLAGQRILVPESRELELFASMLEREGATVLRCPLVTILDCEDDGPAAAWIERLVGGGFDDLVFYTGEGLRRLLRVAERAGQEAAFRAALGSVRKVVRGPKPTRVLRQMGLGPDLSAEPATTDGLVALLSPLDLAGRRVGLQGYPEMPSTVPALLRDKGASCEIVIPYRYVDHDEDLRVVDAIRGMASGAVDAIAFTSTPQIRRLAEVARRHGLEGELERGMGRTTVASIGPVTTDALAASGWKTSVEPASNFHMKPLLGVMAKFLAGTPATEER